MPCNSTELPPVFCSFSGGWSRGYREEGLMSCLCPFCLHLLLTCFTSNLPSQSLQPLHWFPQNHSGQVLYKFQSHHWRLGRRGPGEGPILEHLHPPHLLALLPSVLLTLCLLRIPSSLYPTLIPPLLGRKLLSPSRLPGPRAGGWGLPTCRTHLPRCQLLLSVKSHFSLVVLVIPQNSKAGGLNRGVIFSTIALYLVLWEKWLPLDWWRQ